jgi:hypothetical protein
VHAVHFGPEGEQFLAAENRLQRGLLGHLAPTLHHRGFLVRRRIIDQQLEEEAVGLRLGQRVGAFLLNRVLRRHDEEGAGQRVRLAADGDLPLLHRLEQGALDLGGRAVDFVGQDQVGEDRGRGGR